MWTMMKAKKGRIINISSVVGLAGNPGQSNYAASKAAIDTFTRGLALEVIDEGIRVNCIRLALYKLRSMPLAGILTE